MSCPTCGRKTVAGECADGYMPYLSGDYPCPFNPDPLAEPKNLRVLPPLVLPRAGYLSEECIQTSDKCTERDNAEVVKSDALTPDPAGNAPEVANYSSEGLEDLL